MNLLVDWKVIDLHLAISDMDELIVRQVSQIVVACLNSDASWTYHITFANGQNIFTQINEVNCFGVIFQAGGLSLKSWDFIDPLSFVYFDFLLKKLDLDAP